MADLKHKAVDLENELSDIYAMSEQAACECYNVDYKEEIICRIKEELADIYERLENEQTTTDENIGWSDPAFRTIGDFDRMRV